MAPSDASDFLDDDGDLYEVEKIVKAVVDWKSKTEIHWKYEIKWKGWHDDDNTLEPPENLELCPELLQDFWRAVDTGGRNKNTARLFKVGEELYPNVPSVNSNDGEAGTHRRKSKKMTEAKAGGRGAKRGRPVSESSDDVPEPARHKRRQKVVAGGRKSARDESADDSSDNRPIKASRKRKGKEVASRPHVQSAHRPARRKKPFVDESEPSVDEETGTYKTSRQRPRRSSSASSDGYHSLFSGDSASNNRARSRASSASRDEARSGPSRSIPAALRSRLQQEEAKRQLVKSGIAKHNVNKIQPQTVLLDDPVLAQVPILNAPGRVEASDAQERASAASGPPKRSPAKPTAHTLITVTGRKGLGVVRGRNGIYAQQELGSLQQHPLRPRSASGSVRASPDPIAAIDVDTEPMEFIQRPPEEAPAPPAEDTEPMDMVDKYLVFSSDAPAPSDYSDHPSRHAMSGLFPTMPDVGDQRIPEDNHISFTTPPSSSNKLFLQSSPTSAISTPSAKSSAGSGLFSPSKVIGPLAENSGADSPMDDISPPLAEYASSSLLLLHEQTEISMALRLGPSSKLTVTLKDVHPPTREAVHDLAERVLENGRPAPVVFSQSDDGLPGKLYPHGVLRTLKAQNLSARVVLADDASEQQKCYFDKLVAELRKDKLNDAASLFVLCSSGDKEAAAALDIPRRGLLAPDHDDRDSRGGGGGGVVLQNITIEDDTAYVMFAVDAEDLPI